MIGTGSAGGLANGVNGNLVGVTNPLLAPLGNYGGPTQTMALLPGSPAIDAGTSTGIPTTDQRGLGRVGAVDIGAFESQGFTLTTVAGSTPQTSNIGTAFANPLAVSVTANNPVEPVNGGVVTFVANPAANGATAGFSTPSAVIASGQAATTAAPDNIDGSYQVVASASGSSPAIFNLTNTGPVFAHLIVNTTSDSLFPGAGLLSLPEAVLFADFDRSGNSNITFDNNVFKKPQTITLTGNQLELSNTIETETITGPAAGVTVSGGGLSRVFQVDGLVTASISGLTITGGNSGSSGGGLANFGTTTLTNCTISGNSAATYSYSGDGGGVYNDGTLTMTNCTVSGNSTNGIGGGVSSGSFANSGPTLTMTNCTVSANSCASAGGGLCGRGTMTVSNCTFTGNHCTYSGGGAIEDLGHTLTVTNSSFIGNTEFYGYGGAIDTEDPTGTLSVTGSTFLNNQAPNGNGGALSLGSITTLTNCAFLGNESSAGGAITNFTPLTVTNCTFIGNQAAYGGGIDNA